MITHKKEFGIYHWDTFDNETLLIDEADTLKEAKDKVEKRYEERIRPTGANQVDIINQQGIIVKKYSVG